MNFGSSVAIDGEKIRIIREQKGLTQLYLATVVGVTTDTISRWENRRYPSVKLENAKKLAEALEVSLEELLDPDPEPARQDAEEPGRDLRRSSQRQSGFRWFRHPYVLAALGCGLLAVVVLAYALWPRQPSSLRAVRIVPEHTAPNLAFPVLIRIVGEDAGNTLIVRETLQGNCAAVSGRESGAASARSFGKNPRWIGKLVQGKAVFFYMVKPDRRAEIGDRILFSGDILSREERRSGRKVDGGAKVVITPYHWADIDQNDSISDDEILKAHELYSIPGDQGMKFIELEELWLAGRHTWNKKTQTFVPVTAKGDKE
ncbi:MAG: helix-turn-helix transcriptional regulator [Desulfobulbus sp.]|jgi:transcriptional regulator with XRE-family HTH domain